MSRFVIFIVLLLSQCLGALAIEVPKLERRVTDLAGVLTPQQVAALEAKLKNLEDTDSTQVAILIIPSLEGEYLEGYSIRVAEQWKLGQKGRDNGAILLVSIQDRALRIEVGYGLEGTLTDLRSGRIIRNEIIPRFRQGDYYAGIDAGVTAIIETVRGTYQGRPAEGRRSSRREPGGLFNILIVLLFPLLWILSVTGKWGGGIIGAGAGMLLPYTLIGQSLVLALIGGVVGGLLGMVFGAMVRAGARSGGTRGGPFFWGGGFPGGGGGFGGGGFSGGGGGFGGGGSSGRW